MQEIFSDNRGRQHRLLNKTAAMQRKTDERRTTGLTVKILKHSFFDWTASVCAHSSADIIYLWSWFFFDSLLWVLFSQSFKTINTFLHWWTYTAFMEGDIYSSKVGLTVSYSAGKIFSSPQETDTHRGTHRHRQRNWAESDTESCLT